MKGLISFGLWRDEFHPDDKHDHEATFTLFHPIDQRTTVSDWEGAIAAYPNADNTAWLPKHTNAGTHHDYELALRGVVSGIFQPLLHQYDIDARKATSDETRANFVERYILVAEFYGAVVVKARDRARAYYLGERHQNAHPDTGHFDADVTGAVADVKAIWTETRSADLVKISGAMTYLDGVPLDAGGRDAVGQGRATQGGSGSCG